MLAALLVTICSLAASAVGIEVLSTPKEEAPGSFATHVFAVTNESAAELTYLLAFGAPEGWEILGAPADVTVAPGAEETLFVTVTIPAGAFAADYDIALTATSTLDVNDTASATARVVVTPAREIELQAPTGASVIPGGSVNYEFVLINRGNVQDSFSVEVSTSKQLAVTASPTAVDLAPQERIVIHVRLDVAADIDPGRDALTVTATSTLYDGVETDNVVFTAILPPGPERVGRTLMEVLPARVRLSIDKDVFTGTFSSRLTFSMSGQIVGGFFSSNLSLSDPLGPDPAEVGSFSILYRRGATTYSIGNVSQRLTDLLRLSCRGGSLVIDEELFDITVIGGGDEDETRFAGRVVLGPEEVNLGAAYLGIRTPTPTYTSVWSATASAKPFEDWTLSLEGALGIDGSLSSRAFYFNTEIDTSGFFFSGTAFSVGTHFPGSRADSAGIEASYRLRLTALSLSVSFEHVWDNVIGDPLEPTLIQDSLGFNLSTTPLGDGPTLASTVDFSWDRYPDITAKSDIDMLVAFSLTETSGVFPYAFTGKITDQIDNVLDTHVRRSTFSQGAGLSVDSFYLFLQLTQEKQVDVVSDLVLSSSADVSVRFRPEGTLHEASFAFGNTLDAFDLSASLYIRFVENLDIVFDGSISWDRHDADSISFGWGISLNANIEIPTPFFVTKGQIEGRAFIDRDGDGYYGIEDEPLNAIIIAADGAEASTNPEGRFRFPPFYPEVYLLSTRQLPADAAASNPIEVRLLAGETVWVDIPLAPVVIVSGVLFEDANQDRLLDTIEGGFVDARVLLVDDAGEMVDAFTDATGAFSFPDVSPGPYTIRLDPEALPDRFTFTTDEEAVIEIGAEAPPPVLFGGFIRPRDVIITFQPPTADFVWSPDPPAAGDPVDFDATFSFDFDGDIVSYEWDFDGDGAVDATGAMTQHTFTAPGAYEVSLTVVDDSANADTLTLTIEVTGATSQDAQATVTTTVQPPIADFTYLPQAPQPGEAVQFDGTLSADFDGRISSYAWDFDGDGTIDARDPIASFTFPTAGSYAVTLSVTDDSGSSDVATASLTIAAVPEPQTTPASDGLPVAAFEYSPAEPIAGEPVLFNGTLSLDAGGQIVAFAWDFDGDGEADASAPLAEHTFAGPGAYVVALTVTDDDGQMAVASEAILIGEGAAPAPTVTVSSFQPPVADFAYMPAAPAAGDPVLFNGTFSSDFDGNVVSFAWDFNGDGATDSTDPIAEFSFPAAGTYPVSLTVVDDGGNSDTIVLTIDID